MLAWNPPRHALDKAYSLLVAGRCKGLCDSNVAERAVFFDDNAYDGPPQNIFVRITEVVLQEICQSWLPTRERWHLFDNIKHLLVIVRIIGESFHQV